jgi:hypothetical protein
MHYTTTTATASVTATTTTATSMYFEQKLMKAISSNVDALKQQRSSPSFLVGEYE